MKHVDPAYFFSIWPALCCTAAAFAFACLPMFRVVDATVQAPGRARGIDGLRGVLALSVVVHHCAYYRAYLLDGVWGGEMPLHYNVSGTIAVSMFFMITAFLFWSRIIKERGRPDWTALLIGRLFRIGPLYLATILAMLAYVAVASRGALNVHPAALLNQVANWAALGLGGRGDVNGFPSTELLLAGVTWSLEWEWYFYGSLVLTALAARRPGLHLPFTLAALAGTTAWTVMAPSREHVFALLFSIGMACASAKASGYRLRAPQAVLSAGVLLLVAWCAVRSPTGLSASGTLLLGGAFYLVSVAGSTVFGALSSRAATRLGEISFGVYLLHGLALALVLRTDAGRFAAATSPALYWLLVIGCILLALAAALLAHVAVERPGIDLGRYLAQQPLRRPGPDRAVGQPTA